ncbi:MAG TPA: oligosaccharide flippase family protein [Candidatus Saccharimonadia bacterium]|nr:oligosaccharide flippase family protein [Candidatus Saccharimonadia bacterium]
MTTLSPILARARGSQFLRHNAIFFSGSLVVSVLNYLYYPILGRLLPATSFGEIQAVVSLFLQATIFLGVVGNVAVNVVANEPDAARRSRTVGELERLAGLVVLIGLVAGLLALPAIQRYLHFNDPLPFIILGISLFISVPLSLRQAYLRGVNAFGRLSMSNILSAAAKLLASVAFVLGGFGTAGAIGGLVAAQLIALIYTARYARRLGLHPLAGRWRWPDLAVIRPQLAYAGLVLIISLVTTVQFSFDILVVKHYFSAEIAGAYAGIATIARIIYFLTGSVAGVLLSTVKLGEPAAATRGLLWRSVVLQTVLGGAALTAFALFPSFFTRLLLGPRYLELSSLLPELSLALFVIAFINLLLTYDLALRRYSSAVIAVAGAALTFGAVALHHGTPAAVVRALLIGSVLMLGLRLLDTVRRRLWPHRG